MRREARCTWNVEYQRTRAREALSLLWTTRPGGRQEIDNDPQASLVQARLQAFLGKEQAALVSCDKSLKLAPSPAAWHLKFRLLDSGGGQQDWSEGAELSRSDFAPLGPNLTAAIKNVVRGHGPITCEADPTAQLFSGLCSVSGKRESGMILG